jgi:Tfp pilus assembly protein PilW
MKQMRPPRKHKPGITQVTQGQKKNLAADYNPVHAIQEDKATFSSNIISYFDQKKKWIISWILRKSIIQI